MKAGAIATQPWRLSLASLCLLVAFLLPTTLLHTRLARAAVPRVPVPMPEGYVVMPFENRSGIAGLEWMRVALPFVIGERAEGLARLRPLYGPYVLSAPPTDRETVTVDSIAAFAAERDARWVFTGWIERPDWKLQLAVSLYRVDAGKAVLVHQVVGQGDFKEVHRLITTALVELATSAKITSKDDNQSLIEYESSKDFYAFTIFGRALWAILSANSPGDWETARKTMQRASFIDPTLSEAHRLLASLYLQEGKEVPAKARLELVLSQRPGYAGAMATLARATRAHGQSMAARELYEGLLQLRPWDIQARYEYGELLWELGHDDDAYAQLSAVTSISPNHIKARRALVLIHAKRSDVANLVTELQAVSKLAPQDIPTRLDLAAALVAAGRIEEAIGAYKGIEAIDAKNVQALKFLGDLYRRLGHDQRAIRYYGLAIEAAPGDPRAYFLLGSMYVAAGDDAAARRIYLKAQRFGKFRAESFNNLGAIDFRRDKINQSLWYLRRAVKLRPRASRYHYNLALSLSRTKQADEALLEIETALQLDPDDPESNYLRGVVLLRQGAAEEARKSFERTLQLQPGHVDATHNLALLDELRRKATEGEVVIEGK